MTKDQVIKTFPVFQKWQPMLINEIFSCAKYKKTTGNTIILVEGQFCPTVDLILTGEKRVFKLSESGREVTLYESGPGEVCILNTSCVLSNTKFPAISVASTDIVTLTLEAGKFRELVDKYDEMRLFVFSIINDSISVLLELIVEITFRKMDQRLIDYLIEKAEEGALVSTHQKIANDIGTAREVVSRLLKDFERKGMVSLSRNRIRLVKMNSLHP
jgi:CRP/FNR family transcriptional regulator